MISAAPYAITPSIEARFWARVQKSDGCWEWTGARRNGYGKLGVEWNPATDRMRNAYAHRVSWAIAYGMPPADKDVLHRCDNTGCVRPDHLWLGDHSDNMADMVKKGRARTMRGQANGNAKLTDAQVYEIRFRSRYEEVPGTVLAREYGVTTAQISNIVRGKQRVLA